MITPNASRIDKTSSLPAFVCALAALLAGGAGCREELGACDQDAAREVVYGRSGLVATKGQALLHDSCGQGSFCHSASARGVNRMGVSKGLDFDMLPRPMAVSRVLDMREEIWEVVVQGEMPPKGHTVGDGEWLFDVERRSEGRKLAALSSAEGKGALRNWLACGAPTVADTKVPSWAMPPADTRDPLAAAWTDLHQELRRSCVSSACHDGAAMDTPNVPEWAASTPGAPPPRGFPDGGRPGAASVPFFADECVVYRWLLYNRDHCDQRLVLGGDPGASSLVQKLEQDVPTCGGPMPPPEHQMEEKVAEQMPALVMHVREWVASGALAPQCGDWSELAPRTSKLDAGAPAGAPDWAQLHATVIVPRCATMGCHDAQSARNAGDLDLSEVCGASRALIEEEGPCGKRVTPGDASSTLMDKIESAMPRCNGRMPPGGALSTSEIDNLRDWIVGGALAGDCE